jgi:hypothetical protein
MSETDRPNREPPFSSPFAVKLDGKVAHENLRTRQEAQSLVDLLRSQHPGAPDRVQAFDRWGRRCDGRPI